MVLKPMKTVVYASIAYIFVILTGAVLLSSIIKRESINTWERYISRYLLDKNEIIYNTYFDQKEETEQIRHINFFSLDGYLDYDETFDIYNLEGLIIFDISEGIIHSYNRNLDFDVVNNEKVLTNILEKSYTTSVDYAKITVNGRNLSIISLPLWTPSKKHHISTIYIFGLNNFVISTYSRTMVNGIATALCLAIILTVLVIYYSFREYINNIVAYVEQNTFNTTNEVQHKLKYCKPFDMLEQKLAFLISHRRELEERYTDINDKLYYLVHLTTEGIIMEDKFGLIYYCNQQFANILEYDEEIDLIGLKFTDLFVNEDEVMKYQNDVNLRQMKVNYTYDISLRSRHGKKVYCRLTANVIKETDGSVKGYYGVIMDISGTSTFSISEVQNYKMRSLVFDTNINPIVMMDDKNFVLDANDSFIDFINKKRPDVISRTFDDVIKNQELEKTYMSDLDEFEFYDPVKNQWYFATSRNIKHEAKDYRYLVLYPFSYLKTKTPYHKIVFEDFRGFFFITTKTNQVLFLSTSFHNITKHSDAWFMEYYDSMIQTSPTKTLNLFEPLIFMAANRTKLEFKLQQLYTTSGNFLVYQAIQK